ncbi:MAG: prepilin-type N-terminal cleavage/methylation domain-containing protein [Actinomycetota bacterium]|nr:prepilin-type N-terminal cleavage/methylation domain-containing protein [Actinomycetota bacterium]
MIRPIKNESGYSLVEVMVSIMILAIAIIPMVGMFDTGLKTATTSGNYDKARTLANLEMEQAKSLPFDSSDATVQDVKDNFPEAAGTTTTYTSGAYESPSWKTVTGPASADFTNFRYKVKKQYMTQPSQTPGSTSENFVTSTSDTYLIRVTVTVGWGAYDSGTDTYSNTYSTFGLVTG